jgi:hypothetical protein
MGTPVEAAAQFVEESVEIPQKEMALTVNVNRTRKEKKKKIGNKVRENSGIREGKWRRYGDLILTLTEFNNSNRRTQ